jgi:hypothetical protein
MKGTAFGAIREERLDTCVPTTDDERIRDAKKKKKRMRTHVFPQSGRTSTQTSRIAGPAQRTICYIQLRYRPQTN